MQWLSMGHYYPIKHFYFFFLDVLQFHIELPISSMLGAVCEVQISPVSSKSFPVNVTFLLTRVVLQSA